MGDRHETLFEDKIAAMIEGLRRVKRAPQREWLRTVIEALEQLEPGDRFVITRRPSDAMIEAQRLPRERVDERRDWSLEERSAVAALERCRKRRLTREEERSVILAIRQTSDAKADNVVSLHLSQRRAIDETWAWLEARIRRSEPVPMREVFAHVRARCPDADEDEITREIDRRLALTRYGN